MINARKLFLVIKAVNLNNVGHHAIFKNFNGGHLSLFHFPFFFPEILTNFQCIKSEDHMSLQFFFSVFLS